MLPGDRLVCAFVEPVAARQFKQWPLHVTIVPWFRLSDGSSVIAAGLKLALKTIKPFEVVGDGETMFGPSKNRLVRLLAPSQPLNTAEAKVRGYLHKKRAWLVDETTKKHYDFRPHVTAQAGSSLSKGDKFVIDRLYIVEQKGEFKEVASEVVLG